MKYRYLPATIMLSAGTITIFICMYNRYETLYSLKMLLAVLIIFLIIGSLTKKALIKIMNMSKDNGNDENTVVENADEENIKNEDNDDNAGQIS
nr:hypothetical protein [uncultured Catonella sp.]